MTVLDNRSWTAMLDDADPSRNSAAYNLEYLREHHSEVMLIEGT